MNWLQNCKLVFTKHILQRKLQHAGWRALPKSAANLTMHLTSGSNPQRMQDALPHDISVPLGNSISVPFNRIESISLYVIQDQSVLQRIGRQTE